MLICLFLSVSRLWPSSGRGLYFICMSWGPAQCPTDSVRAALLDDSVKETEISKGCQENQLPPSSDSYFPEGLKWPATCSYLFSQWLEMNTDLPYSFTFLKLFQKDKRGSQKEVGHGLMFAIFFSQIMITLTSTKPSVQQRLNQFWLNEYWLNKWLIEWINKCRCYAFMV